MDSAAATGHRARVVWPYVLVASVALVERLPAFFASAHLHPDDGTYGMSVVAMRHGGVPFRDVFSSQGPLHLPLLFLGDLLGLRTTDAPRVTPVICGVVITICAMQVARREAGDLAGTLAAVLMLTSGSLLWTTGPITADAPTLAFVLLALLAAYRYEERPGTARAVAFGLAIGAAVSCKPAVAVIGLIPAIWIVARTRRFADLGRAAASAAVLGVVVTVPFGVADVWDQAVRYQLDSKREATIAQNFAKVFSTLWDRDVALVVAIAGTVLLLAVAGRRDRLGSFFAGNTRVFAIWTAVMFVFLVTQPALWRNHLAHLVVPLTLLIAPIAQRCAATFSGDGRQVQVYALVALVAISFVAQHPDIVFGPPGYEGAARSAHRALEAHVPADGLVITDEIGLVWRAHRRTPDDFVDASIKQFEQGRITEARVVRAAGRPEVCGVLVWRATYLGSLHGLPQALTGEGYVITDRFAGDHGARVLWVKSACGAGRADRTSATAASSRSPR